MTHWSCFPTLQTQAMAPAKDSGTDSSSNFEVMALTVSAHARLSADFKEKLQQ